MLHRNKTKKSWKSNDVKVANAVGSFRSVSREDKPARSASFVSLTSWLSKNMLFSWKFPGDVSKGNNEKQIIVYTLSHMEVERVSGGRKNHYFICLTFLPMCLPRATFGDRGMGCVRLGLCSAHPYGPWLLTNNKLLQKWCKIGFRDRDPEGQVPLTPSHSELTIK